MTPSPAVIGIVGWKNSGKTTLVASLVRELTARGLRVSTLKHAHHSAEIDQPGSDTDTHRASGAHEVAIVTQNRWAIMHELRGDPEPSMADTLARMSPTDIIIVEGYKNEAHRKIEIQRADANSTRALWKTDPAVVAVVNPLDDDLPGHLARFEDGETGRIADFIVKLSGLSVPAGKTGEHAI